MCLSFGRLSAQKSVGGVSGKNIQCKRPKLQHILQHSCRGLEQLCGQETIEKKGLKSKHQVLETLEYFVISFLFHSEFLFSVQLTLVSFFLIFTFFVQFSFISVLVVFFLIFSVFTCTQVCVGGII